MALQYAVETSALVRQFGTVRALDGIDLAVPAGSVTAFLGSNGSGKTTTIRLLLGLLRPTSGTIAVLGRAMPRERLTIAREIGAMVETPSHYDHLTARENLAVSCRLLGIEPREIDRVLAVVQLQRESHRRVGGYSLGMRQRLGIARALLGNPRLLILDEPVNALDPDGIVEVRDLLRSLPARTGATVFLSSHLLAEVEQTADHVALIASGRLLAQAPLDDLLKRTSGAILVDCDRPADARAMLGAKGIATASEAHGLSVDRGAIDPAMVNRLLVEAGFVVRGVRSERPSLEAIYQTLTRADTLREVA